MSHAVNDFCVVELSPTSIWTSSRTGCTATGPTSLSRRSAQTALYLILDAMTKMFAPILAFTCDEIWLAMPHRAGDDERNVLLNEMVQRLRPVRSLRGGDGPAGTSIAAVRDRRQRRTGARPVPTRPSARAWRPRWTSPFPPRMPSWRQMEEGALADLLIVSQVRVETGDSLSVTVRPACRHQVPALLEDAHQRGYRGRSRGPLPPLRRRGEESPRGGVSRTGNAACGKITENQGGPERMLRPSLFTCGKAPLSAHHGVLGV